MSDELTPEEAALFEQQGDQEAEAQSAETTEAASTSAETPEEFRKELDEHRQDTVPHGRFHAERERRRETEQQLNAARDQMARMEQRFSEFMDRQTRADAIAATGEAPSYDEDPLAHMRWQMDQQQKALGQMTELLANQHNAAAQRQQQEQLMGAYRASAAQYQQDNPDFMDAYRFVQQSRHNELRMMGYSDQIAQQALAAEEMALVNQAMQQGRNPAEVIHEIARARGFSGSEPTQPRNGESTPPTPGEQRLATIARGQAAARSASGTGGSTPKRPSLADLANMSDDDFARMGDDLWRKVAGST